MCKKLGALMLAVLLLLSAASCKKQPSTHEGTLPSTEGQTGSTLRLNVYYPAKDSDSLAAEERIVEVKEGADTRAVVTTLMQEALRGPVIKNHVNFFPTDTALLWVSYADGWAGINFSAAYGTLGTEAVRIANHCVVLTALQLQGVDSVSIYANGELIKTADAEDGTYTASSFKGANTQTAPKLTTVTVYFPDEGREFLHAESRTLEVPAGEHVAYYVMEALMKGTQDSTHLNLMPTGARLLGVSVSGVTCTVNFSAEFVGNFSGGAASGVMLIYSIVNSLTELEGIELVRFQIDGAAIETFAGLDMSEPFTRDGTMILAEKS
ncbi:MAG: GerMN domain-containing protein [Clostridia bacterium]|nr:GerMN domain-containing protein [Clostridia bacterium]